jgi:hypothetical protein
MTKYFIIIFLFQLIIIISIFESKPIIITNNDNDEDDDKYFTNLKYKSDNPARDTSYTTDTLNSFVIPYLLGFNSNDRNLTVQQLASQVFLLSYGILSKAIDNRLYENNRIFVENYIKPPSPPVKVVDNPFKYDENNYLKTMSVTYPRADYIMTENNQISPSVYPKTFLKLKRNNAINNNDIQLFFKNKYN